MDETGRDDEAVKIEIRKQIQSGWFRGPEGLWYHPQLYVSIKGRR